MSYLDRQKIKRLLHIRDKMKGHYNKIVSYFIEVINAFIMLITTAKIDIIPVNKKERTQIMKFVHIADSHFDRPFVSLRGNKQLLKRRRLAQKYTFNKVIDYIKENKIELLFISGDLFEHKYVEEDTINFLISCFKEIPDTMIYITPGNHDPLVKSSPYNKYEFPNNVFIFGGEVGKYEYKNVNIYGIGFTDFEFSSDEIPNIEVDYSKINILITHGTLNGNSEKYFDIKESWLNKFDYVALRTYTSSKS